MRTKADIANEAEHLAAALREARAERDRAREGHNAAEARARQLDYERANALRERDAAREELAQAHRALVRAVMR